MSYMGYDDLKKSSKIGVNGIIKLARENGFEFELVDRGVKLIDPDGKTRTFTGNTKASTVGSFMGYSKGGSVKRGYSKGGFLAPAARPLRGK